RASATPVRDEESNRWNHLGSRMGEVPSLADPAWSRVVPDSEAALDDVDLLDVTGAEVDGCPADHLKGEPA
ncbi:hypothetical protein, partial [Streptomyces sp. NPDC091259]|uniref:hypothetical protein n=1 Tax=Streptomyces sp. NPDC091259 TaxID=3365976 RepID=UPI003801DEA4